MTNREKQYIHGEFGVLSPSEVGFWRKVTGVIPATGAIRSGWEYSKDRCWLWKGGLSQAGYGRYQIHKSRTKIAHRLAYELVIGPIPEGLVLDHLCRRRNCVKPTHLEAVTNLENIERGLVGASRRTHCKHGHPLDEANTIQLFKPTGQKRGRQCRICMEIYSVKDSNLVAIELDWVRFESGKYGTTDLQFKAYRSGSKWKLERNGQPVPRSRGMVQSFPSYKEAQAAATWLLRGEMREEIVLSRLEEWRKRNPQIASEWERSQRSVNFDWEKCNSGNYLSRNHPYRVFRSNGMWRLEIEGNIVDRVFATRQLAYTEACVSFINLESLN